MLPRWLLGVAAANVVVATATEVELIANGMTNWTVPARVARCPIHEAADIQASGGGFLFSPPGGGKFSVVEANIPEALRFGSNTTGLKITYSAASGASGVSLWRIRVTYADDPQVRFVHLFSIPAAGVTDETRHMPWADWTGQILDYVNKRVIDCATLQNEPRCTIQPERISHISFLESEDTIAHAIAMKNVVVTDEEIVERNAEQHHTEEQAALLWEREHHFHRMRGDDITLNNRSNHSDHHGHHDGQHHGHHHDDHHRNNGSAESNETTSDDDSAVYGAVSSAAALVPSAAWLLAAVSW
eukprot:TRINITY_DN20123_c0_g1_i1.p1 TRINITY_DN20123_c0_g1~~TRINITY_DN20123_c0_g1_i1.p1  ORF type:complete len:353 (-),score=56.34 TRINITY_DN20123_c0_g1_i1:94-996(-)